MGRGNRLILNISLLVIPTTNKIVAPANKTIQATQKLVIKSKTKREIPKKINKILFMPLATKIKTDNKGKRVAENIAKLLTLPIVLKEIIREKSKGKINCLKICKIPKIPAKKPETIKTKSKLKISFLLKILTTKK